MKKTINFYEFRDAFMNLRPNNFSAKGLIALFEHFEEYEEATNIQVELDVIAICCDYTQSTIYEALENYGLNSLEELENETIVIHVYMDEIIYLNY